MGINHLLGVFKEKYYENLEGGILESFGRLFRNEVKLYVYPMSEEAYTRYIVEAGGNGASMQRSASSILISAKNVRIAEHLSNLYAHLLENRYIESIVGFDADILNVFSRDVLENIRINNPLWESMVPIPVVQAIKRKRLFGQSGRLSFAE